MKNTVIRALFALLLIQIMAAYAHANGPGNLDLTFAGTGYIRGAALPNDSARDLVIQPDGRILVLTNNFSSTLAFISRFNPDGSLDTSFGSGGRIYPGDIFGFTKSYGTVLLLQPDGKIIYGGLLYNGNAGTGVVLRFNSDGTPDVTFDGDGRAVVNYGVNGGGNVLQAALAPNGKITVNGLWVEPRFGSLYDGTARFLSDGSYDTSFGAGGSLVNFRPGTPFSFQPDGKMIAGAGLRVVRYNADGVSRDASFGVDGVSQAPPLPGSASGRSMTLLPDGKVLITAIFLNDFDYDFATVRYNSDGSLDTTFNGTGAVVTAILSSDDVSTGISLQSDGKIVVCGITRLPDNSRDIALVRYNVDGSLDTNYGVNGKAVIDLGFSETEPRMALDSSDRAVVAGQSQTAFLARFTSEAAPLVDVGGRVISTNGQGIGGATIVLTNAQQQKRYALTNAFGYYGFSGVSSNEIYVVGVFKQALQVPAFIAVDNIDEFRCECGFHRKPRLRVEKRGTGRRKGNGGKKGNHLKKIRAGDVVEF